MAHSIEGRVPFLDHQVAEYAAGIPIHMKINGMREKRVLREAARDILIEPVYHREKHPFSTPPAKLGEHYACWSCSATCLPRSMPDEQPILDAAAVRALFRSFPAQSPEKQRHLDGLMNRIASLTLMHERFGMSI